MPGLSLYAENKLLNHVFKVSSFTPPTHIYVGLSTADPTKDASGLAEPVGNNYARVQCDVWNAASSRSAANTSAIVFNQASGSWGTISHFALFDDPTAGNMLAFGAFTSSKSIVSGNVPTILASGLSIPATSGAISTYLADALLDHLLKTASYTVPTHLYVACHTANPGDDGSGAEVSNSSNYSRAQSDSWSTSTTGALSNSVAIDTPTASGSWSTVTHTAIWDSGSYGGGNMLVYGTISPQQTVGNGDFIEWAISSFAVSLT